MVLLTSAPETLFKNFKRRNYFIKKSNISIFNALVTHIFTKNYFLNILKSAPKHSLTFSLIFFILKTRYPIQKSTNLRDHFP